MIFEFNVFEYISVVRNYFGMSWDEVEQFIMIEFQYLIVVKYLDQKGFIREEYDLILEDYLVKKVRRVLMVQQVV